MGAKLTAHVIDDQGKPVAGVHVYPTSRSVRNEGVDGQLYYPQLTDNNGDAVFADWPGPNPLTNSSLQFDTDHPGYYPASSFTGGTRPTYDGMTPLTVEVKLVPFV